MNKTQTIVNSVNQYPSQAITIIVPYAPGGTTDLAARAMHKVAHKYFGQNLVVKNMPGAGSTLGLNELGSAKVGGIPDGYTVGIVTTTALLQPLYGETRYHYPTAIEPLVQIMDTPFVIAVKAEQPWNDMNDFVSYAQEHPREIKIGNVGLGTLAHVLSEMVAQKTSIEVGHVPFKGGSETLSMLLGGHVQAIVAAPPEIKEHVRAGTVKVLAVSGATRIADPVFNKAPTLQEQGIDIVISIWYGIGAPKTLPDDIKAKLVDLLTKTINDPEYRENLEQLGVSVEFLGKEQFEKKWIEDCERLEKMVRDTGIIEKIAAQKK